MSDVRNTEDVERQAAHLRLEAQQLRDAADQADGRRDRFIADVAAPLERLRRAAGLPPKDIAASLRRRVGSVDSHAEH